MNFNQLSKCKSNDEFLRESKLLIEKSGYSGLSIHLIGSNPRHGISTVDADLDRKLFSCALVADHFINGGESFDPIKVMNSIRNLDVNHSCVIDFVDCMNQFRDKGIIPKLMKKYSVISGTIDFHYDLIVCLYGDESTIGTIDDLISIVVESICYFSVNHFNLKEVKQFLSQSRIEKEKKIGKAMKLLCYMAKSGRTLKESCSDIHIGVDTGNKHIQTAKELLGARTTAQAVYFACQRGLIK